uniref:Uncharacterized protein n=1 Tax=Avena sativa TaxID=4498 RepID=A0ACD5V2H1_AVESA
MNAKRPRSGDLHLLPTTSSPREEDSGAHSISSPPPRRMDWSNLGEGPSGMIAERLLANDVTDYVRFRAVCGPWRQCTADPRAHGTLDRRFLPRRWIMLREKAADPDCRRLLNVSTGQCVRAHLPELRGHDVCSPTVEGLLVLLNWSTYVIRLLNPLTRQVADLLPATTLYSLYWRAGTYDAYPRLDFEVSGAGLAGDGTVAVLFEHVQMLAVAKPGDEEWTLVKQGTSLLPAISFAGRFYCATDSDIKVVDTRDNQPPRLVVAAKNNHRFSRITGAAHLLDNEGELIFLSRRAEGEDFFGEAKYFMKVSQVDLEARKTQPIRDLGGRAVFIGSSCAISVPPLAFPGIEKNSVYFLDEGSYFQSIGRYKIVDGTTMSFDEGSGITEACGFNNSIRGYGPHSIIDYLSQYVKKDTFESFAEKDASDSDSDSDANCVIC